MSMMGMGGMGGGMGGMGGGMGGMGGGMGGMGGGMGGMGGGMGGMGGGFRSVPPTGLPHATLNPGQTRHLPANLVSLNGPSPALKPMMPAKGEALEIGDVSQLSGVDPRVADALRRLASDKAPVAVSQIVMWNLSAGIDWTTIARLSRVWANANELALARQFAGKVARGEVTEKESQAGAVYLDITGGPGAAEIKKLLKDRTIIGLTPRLGIPARPEGPAVACRIRVDAGETTVQVSSSDATGREWVSSGKFSIPTAKGKGTELDAASTLDAVAEGLVNRLIRVQLVKGKTKDAKGNLVHRIQLENASPLMINGIALVGLKTDETTRPTGLAGLSVPPRRRLSIPASSAVVDRLGLKDGVRVLAADLSGL
jgi:hypothetical protein